MIDRFLTVTDRIFVGCANACMVAMLASNIVNLALRNTVGTSIVSVWPWTLVLFVWMIFFAFFPIYRRNVDITVEVLVLKLPVMGQVAIRLMVDLLALLVMLVMLVEAPRIFETQVGIIDFVGLQRYVLSIPLFASSALIGLHFLLDLVEAIRTRRPPRPRFFEEAGS